MYDTIQMYLPAIAAPDVDLLGEVPIHLTNTTFHDNGSYKSYDGRLRNLKVYVTESRVKISGSFSKFYTGQNIRNITKEELRFAIEELSDQLHLPIEESKITRLDVGYSFIVRDPPKHYFRYFGDCQGFDRLEQPSGINYRNKHWEIYFYDKLKECLDKRISVPKEWVGKNVLRYELRFKKRIPRLLQSEEIKVYDLTTTTVSQQIAEEYLNKYQGVYKIPNLEVDLSKVNTVSDYRDLIGAFAIKHYGHNYMIELLNSVNDLDAFNRKEYISRSKKMIKTIQKRFILEAGTIPIEELDKQIESRVTM